jgi:hypothetical protein
VLLALDEAGNIPLHNLSEALGVGRGRRCGIVLGYQNIGQLYKQHGRDGAQAILGSIGTMVFLPGLDAETAQYAAKRIGRTTVLQHSVVDATGDVYDHDRLSETGRDLLDAAELRQMPEHTQAVAITGSAPPIKFGFPSCGKIGPLAHPLPRDIAQPPSLNDAEAAFAMRRSEKANEEKAIATTESPIPIGAPGDEIHPANELYPAFDSDVLPEGAQGSIDSIIDALLDSLPLPKSDTAVSPPPPASDPTTPFDAPLDVHYEKARDYGHTFRFSIRDESLEANRRISILDVHRRAGARGDRAADVRGAGQMEDRLAIRGQAYEADVRRHSPTLEEHGKKLDTLVSELGAKAKNALDSYRHVQRLAGEVIEKYQKRGEPLPMPFVKREDLVKTQDEAVKHRFAGHTEKLERLRVALAEEHGQPMRSDREAARLAAQVFTAGAELKAREERARRFDETRHLRQWEIKGEKFSLADIDRRVERLSDAAAMFGRYELHIDPSVRRQASAEIERLGQIRQEIIEKTDGQQGEMSGRVNEAGKLLETLSRAYARETTLREQSGLSMPAPQFTREELERAADNIERVRDASFLRQLSAFERRFNTYADPRGRFTPVEGWGRAPARAAVAEIFHRESNERLDAFEKRGEIQPLLIETSDGRLITHSLQGTMPQSLIEQITRPLIETEAQRELRHVAKQAFARYENGLKADYEQTRSYLEAAREIVTAQAAERASRAGQELPAPEPALTPKQAMAIEIYAERQADPKEREHFLSLARGSASSHLDSHSHTNSHERHTEREVASAPGRAR